MSTREIVTLQFGHYSNYIGAHFWNIQELSFDYTNTIKTECNHDILYREGKTLKGEITYTPRLLVADLKGSLKTLPVSGGLPADSFSEDTYFQWENIEKIEEPIPNRNDYLMDIDSENATSAKEKIYNLENDINTWTDYLYPRFNPRTVNIVKEYQHADESECFDISHKGRSIWNSDYGENFSDNIRKYAEECDSMQGFQVNFDCTDGFSGLAMGCIEYLADEFTKPILVYPVIASHFPDNNVNTPEDRDKSTLKDTVRLVNIALSIDELSQHASLFVPLCTGERGWRKPGNPRIFDNMNYNPELYYHSSAVLASAIDTLGQKYRHKNNLFTMSDVCADMTGYGRKMAAASLGLPLPIQESEYLIDFLNNTTKPIYNSITPSCKIGNDKIFQLITVRGIPESFLKPPIKEAKVQSGMPAYQCRNTKEMFELYFQSHNFLSPTNVTVCEKPLEVKTPFPNIFSEKLNRYGFIKNSETVVKVESCPVIAGYHNGQFMGDTLEKLQREVSRIKYSKLHKFKEQGFESAEYQEMLDRLSEFKDTYYESEY